MYVNQDGRKSLEEIPLLAKINDECDIIENINLGKITEVTLDHQHIFRMIFFWL